MDSQNKATFFVIFRFTELNVCFVSSFNFFNLQKDKTLKDVPEANILVNIEEPESPQPEEVKPDEEEVKAVEIVVEEAEPEIKLEEPKELETEEEPTKDAETPDEPIKEPEKELVRPQVLVTITEPETSEESTDDYEEKVCHLKLILKTISSGFSDNSEALLENLEELYSLYW